LIRNGLIRESGAVMAGLHWSCMVDAIEIMLCMLHK